MRIQKKVHGAVLNIQPLLWLSQCRPSSLYPCLNYRLLYDLQSWEYRYVLDVLIPGWRVNLRFYSLYNHNDYPDVFGYNANHRGDDDNSYISRRRVHGFECLENNFFFSPVGHWLIVF